MWNDFFPTISSVHNFYISQGILTKFLQKLCHQVPWGILLVFGNSIFGGIIALCNISVENLVLLHFDISCFVFYKLSSYFIVSLQDMNSSKIRIKQKMKVVSYCNLETQKVRPKLLFCNKIILNDISVLKYLWSLCYSFCKPLCGYFFFLRGDKNNRENNPSIKIF